MTQIVPAQNMSIPSEMQKNSESCDSPALQADHHEAVPTSLTTNSGLYPQFLLFGDSITENSTASWQAALQRLYSRRVDIINRGYSGYNTTLAVNTIPHFLPLSTPSPQASPCTPPIKLATIFFGANDACIPGWPQHVPLPLYLKSITQLVNYPVFRKHDTKIVIVTPPPINEHQLGRTLRTVENAARYARAAKQLAIDLSLPYIDLWTAFMTRAGYTPPSTSSRTITVAAANSEPGDLPGEPEKLPGSIDLPENKILASFFEDGLHLSPTGYDVLHEELMKVIRNDVSSCAPENLPYIFKGWRQILM